MKSNIELLRKVLPILLFITNPKDIEALIQKWKPDIVKMDIEGAEINLLQMKNSIFQEIPHLMIEIHDDNLLELLIQKCKINDFLIIRFSANLKCVNRPPYIVHAAKRKCE